MVKGLGELVEAKNKKITSAFSCYIKKNSTAPKVKDYKNYEDYYKAERVWTSKNPKRLY